MTIPDAQIDAPRREFRFVLVITLAWSIVAVPWLIGLGNMTLSREPVAEAGAFNLGQLVPFMLGAAGMWIVLTVLFIYLETHRRRESVEEGKPRRNASPFISSLVLILVLACAARVIVIFNHSPTLSDDIWRYVFDGYVVTSGDNPYRIPPQRIDPANPRFEGEYALANRLNNPDLVTIYLPVSQLVFGGSAWISDMTDDAPGERVDPDHASIVFRLVFFGFELAAMLMLALVLWVKRRGAWYLALYAWHPLPIVEFAGSGHQDAVGIALMVAALTVWELRPQFVVIWTALLALAGCVKPLPIPMALPMARLQSHWIRALIIAAATGAVVCFGCFAIFFAGPGFDTIEQLRATVNRFVDSWAFHGSVYEVLLAANGDREIARRTCFILLAVILIALIARREEPWKACRVFLFAALLLSTTAWPWYLLWAFVLIPVRPSPALWLASLTILTGYVVFGDMITWRVPWWSPWLTYVPVYTALIADLAWRRARRVRTTANRT